MCSGSVLWRGLLAPHISGTVWLWVLRCVCSGSVLWRGQLAPHISGTVWLWVLRCVEFRVCLVAGTAGTTHLWNCPVTSKAVCGVQGLSCGGDCWHHTSLELSGDQQGGVWSSGSVLWRGLLAPHISAGTVRLCVLRCVEFRVCLVAGTAGTTHLCLNCPAVGTDQQSSVWSSGSALWRGLLAPHISAGTVRL